MVVNWCLLFNVNSLDSNNMWPVAFLTVAYFVDLYYLIVLGYDRMSYPYKFDPRFFIKTIAMVLIKKWGQLYIVHLLRHFYVNTNLVS